MKNLITKILVCTFLFTSSYTFAASSKFLNVETIIVKPESSIEIQRYGINVASHTDPVKINTIKNLDKVSTDLVYSTKVKVNNVLYYRLVTGNFSSSKKAQQYLQKVKKYFPEAWLNLRLSQEKQQLSELLSLTDEQLAARMQATKTATPVLPPVPVLKPVVVIAEPPVPATKSEPEPKPEVPVSSTGVPDRKLLKPKKDIITAPVLKNEVTPEIDFAAKLLEQARQLFLDRNYTRAIAVSNKVIEIGSIEQKQRAMEFVGIARERQRKFAQAVAIYSKFIDLYPDSKITPRIKIRLTGLKTMRSDPKSKIASKKRRKGQDDWNIFGSLSQYYRDDVLETDQETEEINSSLVSDLNFVARRKTDKSALVLRFDGGFVNDFVDNESDARISRAMVNYTNNDHDYQLIGGRQSRTAKGVLGRFDGLVYKGLSHDSFEYSVYSGFPVQSSFDSLDSDRLFYGASVNFKPAEKVVMDVYLVHQNIFELTDRQAIGTEFQYRNDSGFLYGIIDYDLFYEDINNITAITNYRYTDRLVFNVTYDYRNSPLLTTINALQGQTVASIEELQELLTDDEIHQLAQDRTSKSQNLFIGSNYQIDDRQQVYLSLSLSSVEATVESGGVAAAPATEDVNVSGDYSVTGLFSENDYTTFGFKLSDTSSSDIISFSIRSRLPGSKEFRYDPRLRLDYRESKTSEVNQYIVKPSLKVTYKPNKKVNFEASLGIEYSNFDLPELSDQTQYNFFLGYVYRF